MDVLVVDDYAPTRIALTTLLRDEGYMARGTAAHAAIGAVERLWPDVMIVDYDLADNTAAELVGAIRAIGCHCAVIGITGAARMRLENDGEISFHTPVPHITDALAVLIKPIDMSRLLCELEQYAAAERATAGSEPVKACWLGAPNTLPAEWSRDDVIPTNSVLHAIHILARNGSIDTLVIDRSADPSGTSQLSRQFAAEFPGLNIVIRPRGGTTRGALDRHTKDA